MGADDTNPVFVGWPVAPASLVGFGDGAKSAGVGTDDTNPLRVGCAVASSFLVGF